MHKLSVEDDRRLVVQSYPVALVAGILLFAVLAFIAGLFSDEYIALQDIAIFYGIIAVFVSIHTYRKVIFDQERGVCTLCERAVWMRREVDVSFADIDGLEMSYGRGSGYARGGTLVMVAGEERYNIIENDLNRKNEQKTKAAMEQIKAFLLK